MLNLKRTYFKDRTEGQINLPNGEVIFTLERPWKDNKPYISCIPEGEYIVSRDHTGKFQYYVVNGVEGRSAIEIHPANLVTQLQGCIAPCMGLKEGKGIYSTKACKKLLELFGEDSFHLVISS